MWKVLFAASAVCAVVSGCQTTGTVGADWTPNDRAHSNVSIVGDDSFVLRREWKRRSAGTQERLTMSDGQIFFEELYGGNTVWQLRDDEESLRSIFAAFNKSNQFEAGPIGRREYAEFNLYHLTAMSSAQNCFLGDAISDKARGGWHVLVSACRANSARNAAGLESDMFDIVSRLRFDGGALNKAAAAADTTPTRNSAAPNKPMRQQASVAFTWEGHDAQAGFLEYESQGRQGALSVRLEGKSEPCRGTWDYLRGAFGSSTVPEGTWKLTCADGISAAGTYRTPSIGSGNGTGTDNKGNRITFTYGT